ncbi:Carboxylesterase patB [Fulvia fulva]|uniref:Carboxylic ester hydrolase n=1 Tax=Passalora fulva TaxID=5499 RepID=A0A9Q8PJB1_PASFU|nr:Carboxylesterase patB [Fulvia fulva]KAK4612174.1 Carboxylesterase patB [Fulvia fulva]KAK4613029.1 Carboxylesterase patB [Fulvia fulva]UJO23503.1 Carboxylesterase patB [Fulvia fulva]WPV21387.1 Carboxylesterase patB [Fulvia fulva]WPV36381.1 Carboxylesterase patB [Fulvia fulva]
MCDQDVAALPSTSKIQSGLPVVDLGYQLQRATTFNDTGNCYNFLNIRYAQAPTGQLRFREPAYPKLDRVRVKTGDVERICPQARTVWSATSLQFVQQYLQGKTQFLPTDFPVNGSAVLDAFVQSQDPRESEDCLFLNIMVPKQIFDNRKNRKTKKAAALVWIHGGGYTAGSKTSDGSPAGLLARSQDNEGEGVIFTAMNYRLGALGFSSGPTFTKDGGTANAALYDQRAALIWVQQHIHLFGGGPKRITVIGESAGAGSLMHQITAFGGKPPAPLSQAILQSPGFQPVTSATQQEATYNTFLDLLNVTNLAQARQLPSASLRLANILQVGLSPYGQFT